MKRRNRIVLTLNDKEKIFLDRFCNKYKIQNRSKLLRETIMSVFLKKLDEDYPTLWGDKE
jgi:metal-responsive CopG/Arc/MetJ family transcriptional regulator